MDSAETPLADQYDASAITILDAEEAKRRFGFALAAHLAVRYSASSPDFIARLLEACQHTGFPIEVAVRRYLAKDREAIHFASTAEWETLTACHLDLIKRRHQPR